MIQDYLDTESEPGKYAESVRAVAEWCEDPLVAQDVIDSMTFEGLQAVSDAISRRLAILAGCETPQ